MLVFSNFIKGLALIFHSGCLFLVSVGRRIGRVFGKEIRGEWKERALHSVVLGWFTKNRTAFLGCWLEFVVVGVGLVELGQEVLKVWMSTYCKGMMEKKVSGVVQLFGELHSQRE